MKWAVVTKLLCGRMMEAVSQDLKIHIVVPSLKIEKERPDLFTPDWSFHNVKTGWIVGISENRPGYWEIVKIKPTS